MNFLEELETRVRDLLKKYKDVQEELLALKKAHETLKESCTNLEAALLQESTQVKDLLEEKESIKVSIDELLVNIKTLEETQS